MKNKKKMNEELESDISQNKYNFHDNGKFFIYGDIDETFPQNIIAPFATLVQTYSELTSPPPIEIWISSSGGDLSYTFDLITLMELAIASEIEILTYVTSTACSAASLIAVSGSQRVVSRRAYHLLHFARGADYSHNPIMSERNLENMKFLQSEMLQIYSSKTKLNIEQLEKDLLADNFIINGGQNLIDNGLADILL